MSTAAVSAATAPLLALGWSLHLPGVPVGATLAEHVGRPGRAWAWQECAPADRAASVLGRKGLLYKEPATRLALCAVHRALGLPAGRRAEHPLSPRTAVVACGNLGNVETVARVARTVAVEGGRSVSVLDAPNVSSNVIASTVARWFGFGGPNLMVCSGGGAGFDGLRLAGLLLRAGRAERVVLVGVEPADEVAAALRAGAGGTHTQPLRAGAACVVLQACRPERPATPGQVLVELLPQPPPRPRPRPQPQPQPQPPSWPRPAGLVIGPGGFDPARHWGDFYGARGVVALALAAHLAGDEGHPVVGVRDEGGGGPRAALVSSAAPAVSAASACSPASVAPGMSQ